MSIIGRIISMLRGPEVVTVKQLAPSVEVHENIHQLSAKAQAALDHAAATEDMARILREKLRAAGK